ncbi:MAG: phosphate ABC transporter ATP-binding protein [Anaerolineaceae bacterium]|jgi:phosphate transport system ATP-binding protein|nr:phosphate ABC transporter ATP-binding protein [Anaerolineaceae bacterium]
MYVSKPITLTTKAPQLEEALPKTSQPAINIGQINEAEDLASLPVKMAIDELSIFYGKFRAISAISMNIPKNRITALIGPSGCGKSTLLRSLNRMNDLIQGSYVEGQVLLDGQNIYDPEVDVVDIRQRVGMVFQRPNPFPMSVFDNVAYGPRLYGIRKKSILEDIVEKSLRQAAVWNDVKDKLHQSGLELSGGQQQRLCIARAIAVEPSVILMDEPASALDPIATLKIEELMENLKQDYTIVIVTHNMQQAARVSDFTAFLMINQDRSGTLVEFGPTEQIFTNPHNQQTEDYVTGRFG